MKKKIEYIIKKVKKSAILKALRNEKLVQDAFFEDRTSKVCKGPVCAVAAILRVASFETEFRKRGKDPNALPEFVEGDGGRFSEIIETFDAEEDVEAARRWALKYVKHRSFPDVLELKLPVCYLEG